MECCIFIFVIIIIVVVLVFGTMILGLVAAILNVVYLLFMDFANWIKRSSWAKTLAELPYEELKKMLSESETTLSHLKSTDKMLTAKLHPTDDWGNFFQMLKIDANTAKMNDTKAKIVILNSLLKKQQPLEDIRLAELHASRQKELKSLAFTTEYKLIEQFARKNLNEENKDDLPKLKLLLESKGWNVTAQELQDLVANESRKQYFENVKSKILANNPETQREILKSYLNYYQPLDVEIIVLEKILEEKNLSFSDLDKFEEELEKVKQEIETEQFEKA